jgi:hypothetical protein
MDDGDFWGVTIAIGMLAAATVLLARIQRQQENTIVKLREDVNFLMDHPVSRETQEEL